LYQSGLLIPVAKTAIKTAMPSARIAFAAAGPFLESTGVFVAEFTKQISEKLKPDDGSQTNLRASTSALSTAAEDKKTPDDTDKDD
jgi:hypothetical protein